MPTKPLSSSKNGYQIMLNTYIKRRQKMWDSGKKTSLNLSKKIDRCRCAIKKYEIRKEKLNLIRNYIIEFIGIDVKDNQGKSAGKYKNGLARSIFFKYSMENGILGSYSSEYLKLSKRAAQKNRISFTKSFKTNKENRETYHRFLAYVKENK